MPCFERNERAAYLLILLGFVTLVGLLRSDLGKYLSNGESLFYKVPSSVPAPRLSVRLDRWGTEPVLRLDTENFQFADYCRLPDTNKPLVGHAHLYLNGRKHASLYQPVVFLRDLPPGEHTLTVSLNVLPDHRTIMVAETPVSQDLRLRLPFGQVLSEHAQPDNRRD